MGINWTREIERHSLLEARRLHLPGPKRQAAEGEAADSGRKVIVFSYFRDVLETVIEALGGRTSSRACPSSGR
jgi:hypothetical protein